MTISLESLEPRTTAPVSASGRFDQISIALHWLTVLLIVGQFASIWLRAALDQDTALAVARLTSHRSMGVLIWVVALARLIWRRNFAYLPPFPAGMPKLQRSIATASEYGLYALLLIQPITGLGRTLFRGQPFELFIWQVPALLPPNPGVHRLLADVHAFGANALLALIGLHAGAALFHRLVLRDDVLQRMLPWTSRDAD